MSDLSDRLARYLERIERVLAGYLAANPRGGSGSTERTENGTGRLLEAMRYSALGGGKRLRPTLVYVTGESLGAPLERLDPAAAAVELIHVYSLVHDDLPSMDDDDLRRGRPTCHRAYRRRHGHARRRCPAGAGIRCDCTRTARSAGGGAIVDAANTRGGGGHGRHGRRASHRPRVGGKCAHPGSRRRHAPAQDRRTDRGQRAHRRHRRRFRQRRGVSGAQALRRRYRPGLPDPGRHSRCRG